MSYTYLQEQGEESSADSFSDIPPYVLSRLNLTAEKSCCNGSEMESSHDSQYGMTFAHSMVDHGGDTLISSRVDFLAKTYQPQEKAQASKVADQDSGEKWLGSLARYDHDLRSWKTAQCLLQGGLEEYSETWPRWGMMLDGVCWGQTTLGLITSEIESGLLPTPRKQIQDRKILARDTYKHNLEEYLGIHMPHLIGSRIDPNYVEWMMAWPDGWTDLEPLETARFQQWRHSHGVHLAE